MIEFLDHTADIRIRITGSSFAQLFRESLQAMNQILGPIDDSGKSQSEFYNLEVKATDRTTLLVDFLSEVLTQTHISNVLYDTIDFVSLEETGLRAQLSGYTITAFEEDIKAVTYHEAEVIEKDGTWSTVIVFDI